MLLTVSTVSATDNVTDDTVVGTSDNVTNDVVGVNDEANTIEVNDEDIITVSSGAFNDLSNDIANATDELNLTKDYIFDSSLDSSYYSTGLNINKKIVINGNGFTIDGQNCARAFKINFDNVCLYNITFKNCYYSYDGGGAIYWDGANGILDNCNFINCYFKTSDRYSSSYGGAVYWNGNNGNIKSCNFEDCYSQSEYGYSDGGAIYLSGMGCILDNCIFNQCNVKGSSLSESKYGGALYINGVKNSISNCEFNNCYAKSTKNYISSYGGAIYWNTNDGYLDNCTFNKCEAITQYSTYSYGGAICWLGINGTALNSKFNNCSSLYITYDNSAYYSFSKSDNGGAISWLGDNGTLKNNNFTDCYSKSTSSCGGAVYWEGNYGMIKDNIFKNCSANSGGAIYFQGLNGSTYNNTFIRCFSTCEIISSYAATSLSYGGAIYWNGNNGIVSKSKFNECYSKSHCDSYKTSTAHTLGGAIYWNGNNGNLNNCTFNKCYANASSIYESTNLYSEGGNIYWNGIDGSLTQNIFNSCISSESEVIYCNGIHCKLTNCSFNNTSDNYVINWKAINGTLNNCNFVNQTIYWCGANGILDNCNFVNCSSENGGAIYYISNGGIISNCNFINCSSTEYGGASYIDCINFTLSNCNFIICSSENGGAIYCKNNNNTIVNCTFINCSSNKGGAINWIGNNGILTHNNFTNCFANNSDDNAYGSAIYLKANNCILNNCIFTNLSYCSNPEHPLFGSIYWYGDNGNLTNCIFNNCSSINAATIYWNGVNSNLIDCKITNCSAQNSICIIYGEGNITNFKVKNSFSKNGLVLDKSSNFIVQNLMIDDMDEFGEKFSNLTDNTLINLKQNHTAKNTILICSNNITIDGNGYTIDANNLILFNIQGNNITIKNTKILNLESIDFYGNGFKLINCTFINGTTNKTFLSINDDYSHMINCNFENCSSKWYLIELNCINSTITNCKVTNSSSNLGIQFNGDYGIISNCDFKNFIDTKLQIKLNGFNHITDCNFNNVSIYSDKANTTISNCSFNNTTVTLSGNNVLMYGCNFTSDGLNWGWSGINGILKNCRFVNSHRNYGGAIMWGGDYGLIINCSFINNTATNGGAIYMDGTNGTIINSTFINNTAIKGNNVYIDGYTTHNGLYQEDILKNNFIDGGIYTEIKSITSIVKVNSIYFSLPDVKSAKLDIYFKNGTYYQIDIINGTAILTLPFGSYEINASLNNSNYSLINTGYKNYLLEDSLNGLFSNIEKNSIINIYRDFNFDKEVEISSNEVVVDGNGFTLNFTELTHSFILSGKNIILKNINFVGANTTNLKGIIRCEEDSSVSIINCTFINNGDSNYRSIYSQGQISITNCTFINNSFNKAGSCIYLPNDGSSSSYILNVNHCKFINCSSASSGGAIFGVCDAVINNCTFENCKGGTGGAIFLGSDGLYASCWILKSNFINCSANNGGAISLSEMNSNVNYNSFINVINSTKNGIYIISDNSNTNNLDYNWWGSNIGPQSGFIIHTQNKNYIPERWLIVNATITPTNISDDCLAIISTYFVGYDITTGKTVNLTSDIVRPAKYEVSEGTTSTNSVGEAVFNCNKVGHYPVSINITVDNQVILKTFNVFKKITPLVNVSISDCMENKSKIFIIETPNDLTNNFNITITGENGYRQTISNIALNGGTYTKEIKNLLPSNYTIYVKYDGDEGYYPIEKSISFKVTKFDPAYTVKVTNAIFKQNATITVSIPNISGNVTINIANITKFDDLVIDNGEIVKNVSNLDAGNYLVEITYNGNEYYNTFTQFVNLTIAKASNTIKVYVNDSKYGEDTIINVTSDITCQLFVKINNTIKDINVTANELQSINFGKLNASNYTVIVSFDGDKNYNVKTYSTKLTINKLSTTVMGTVEDITYSQDAIVNVKGSVDGIVVAKIDDTFIENINIISNSIAPVTFENIPAGKHNVTITLKPSNINYDESTYNTDFTVNKKDTTVKLDVANSVYGDDVIVNVTASEDGKIILKIGDITKEKNVFANTVTKINFGVLAANSYDVIVSFDAGDNYKPSNDEGKIIVSSAEAKITDIQANNNIYGENTTITVKTNIGGILTVKINNIVKTFNIDANKLTSFDLGKYDVNTYDIDLTLDAGANYTQATGNTKVTITPKQTTVSLDANDEVYGNNVIVKVTASENGKVTVRIGNIVKSVNVDANKVTSVDFGILDVNSYEVSATFDGGKNFNTSSDSDSFEISPKASSVTFVNLVNNYIYSNNVVVNVKSDVVGTVTVKVGDKTQTKQITAGNVVSFDFGILDVNKYDVLISLNAGSNYISSQNNASISISPKSTVVTLNIGDYNVDENVIVNVTASENGKATIKLGNVIKNVDVMANKIASLDFGVLSTGSYDVVATFTAGNNYIDSSDSANIKVLAKIDEKDINITVPEIKPNQENNIVINLPEDATGTVTLIIGENAYTFNVKNGIANINVPKLDEGNYKYVINYSGDSKYSSFENTGSIDVAKPDPEIVIPPLDEPSEDGSVAIKLPSDATGTVTLVIDGKVYSFPVVNGVANVYMPELNDGNYNYSITYSGDGKYSPFTTGGNLNIIAPKITAKNTAVQYSAKGKYSVTVYGTDGKVANGVEVIFKISGKQVGKAKTNVNGVASYVVTKNPGKYKIQATALGKSITKTLTVKHIVTLKTVTLKKSAKKLTLQATLAKVNGKYLKKKTITFKINGKKVATAKTNSKGVAKITIKNPSVVKKLKVGKKVTYQATYLKDTVKKTAKIKK